LFPPTNLLFSTAANFELKTEFVLDADCPSTNATITGTLSLLASSLKAFALASPRLTDSAFNVDQREALGLRNSDDVKITKNLPDMQTHATVDVRFNFTLLAASGNATASWTWTAVSSGAALKLINATLDLDEKPAAWNTTTAVSSNKASEGGNSTTTGGSSQVLTGGLAGKLTISDAIVTVQLPGGKLASNTNAAAATRDDAALTVTAKGKLGGKLKLNIVNAKGVSQLKSTVVVSDGNVFLSNARNVDADDDGDARARVTLHVDFDNNRTISTFTQAVADINGRAVSADLSRSVLPWTSVGVNASEIASLQLLGSSKAALNLSALFTSSDCFNSNVTSSVDLTATLNSAGCRARLINPNANDTQRVAVKEVQMSWQPPQGLTLRVDASLSVADFLAFAKNRSSVVASMRAFSASFAAISGATVKGQLLRDGTQYFREGSSFVAPNTALDAAQAKLEFAFSLTVNHIKYFGGGGRLELFVTLTNYTIDVINIVDVGICGFYLYVDSIRSYVEESSQCDEGRCDSGYRALRSDGDAVGCAYQQHATVWRRAAVGRE
jgi:hypothetical protein